MSIPTEAHSGNRSNIPKSIEIDSQLSSLVIITQLNIARHDSLIDLPSRSASGRIVQSAREDQLAATELRYAVLELLSHCSTRTRLKSSLWLSCRLD